ncbi:MAG: radical SAM protein, partial [Candidatus Omnitrophota bacterium]
RKWRKEFCQRYKKDIGLPFGCLLRANVVDEEFIRLLKAAGCYRIEIGIESGNDYIRNDVMRRGMSNEQVIRAFALARSAGIETNAINIIGTPGEDEEMIWDTIRLNRLVRPTTSSVNIFYPYRGTKLGDDCFEKGLVDKNLYGDFSNERRETVLNYPDAYKKKLLHYSRNWEALVYPFDLKRRGLRFVRRSFIGKYLRTIKRSILGVFKLR